MKRYRFFCYKFQIELQFFIKRYKYAKKEYEYIFFFELIEFCFYKK